MKHQPLALRPNLLVLILSLFFSLSKAQTIQPYFFGINAWMPDTIGNASNCTDPPCLLNGKIHSNWQKIKDSKTQIVRYGGITVDKNMPTNYQYIRMIDSVRSNGMEPIIQVPYYNGRYSAQQAAAIVQYINKTRGKNIKYWIIGNEPDLKYSITTASQVAAYIKPFATAMKAVDSTIKIVGPETAWFNKSIIDGLTNPGGSYDITGKDNNGHYYVDVISFHTYPMGDNNTTLPGRGQLIAKLTGTNSFESNLAYLNTRLTNANTYHSRTGANVLRPAVTEANVVYANNSADNIYGVGANSFLGGQFVAEIYGIGLNQGLAFINLWSSIEGSNIVSNIGFIDKTTGNKKPLFYHYKLMADHFKGSSISATDNQANVKVFASKDAQRTTVMIMNEDLTTNHLYSVKLNTTAVTGTNSLQVNVNAGITAQYNDTIKNQSTILLQFDGQGNLTRKCVYSLSVHAVANLAPTYIDYPVVDLKITSSSVSTASAIAGASVQVQSTIYNSGSSTATVSKVGYYLSADSVLTSGDTFLGYAAGAALQASASAQRQAAITIPSGLPFGNYFLLAKADYANEVVEVNENNNVSASTFSILQTPNVDLVIQNPIATPTNVLAGAVLTLTSNIVNTGSTTAFGGKIGYYISSDTLLDSGDGFMAYSSPATLTPNSSAQKTKTVSISAGMPAGTFYILLFADYANDVSEVNELNNIARVKINISLPASSDLVISTGALSASTVFPGSALSLSATIANTGSTNATSSKIGFYLSSDTTLGSGDTYLGFAAGNTLNATSAAAKQSTVILPSALSLGQSYILMVADYDMAVTETNELNNVRALSFSVVAIPAVDLKISSVVATPSAVVQGGIVTLSCTVLNSGTTTATQGRTGYYISSDTLLDSSDGFMAYSSPATLTPNSSAQKTKTVSIASGMPAGMFYILLVADYANEVSEINEQNNITHVKIKISVPALSDLVISAGAVSASTAFPGSALSLSASIANTGSTNATSSKVGFYLSSDTTFNSGDTFLGFVPGGTLNASAAANKQSTVSLSANLSPGQYYVLMVADYDLAVVETNELNNVCAIFLNVKEIPSVDLKLTNALATPTAVLQGGIMTLSCTVLNSGSTSAGPFKTGYYISSDTLLDSGDNFMAFSPTTTLTPGASIVNTKTVSISGNQAAGNYYLLFVTDYAFECGETNELNNIRKVKIQVSTPPKYADLVIQSPSVSATSVIAGKQFILNATIYNQGNAGASSSKVAYYLSQDTVFQSGDLMLGSSAGGSLAISSGSQKSFTAKISLNQKGGKYYVLFVADYDGSVTESNESNNVSYRSITVVGKKQDLSITSMSGSRMMSGSRELETYITLNNEGNVFLTGSVTYYLSSDKLVDESDVQIGEREAELDAGEQISLSTNLEIPENTGGGSWFIIAVADNKNEIEEIDESNNIRYSAIIIEEKVTGLNDFEQTISFNAYPNPCRGRLVVESALREGARIDIIDLAGNVVLSWSVESSVTSTELDLGSLRDGVYIVRMSTESAVNTKSVILAR